MLLSFPFLAHAGTYKSPIKAETLDELLKGILDVVVQVGAIAVVFFIILTGLKYVMARGNEKAISDAHSSLAWTLVGAGVVLGAKVISLAIQGTVSQLH
jgi:NADH:ubiquinone oxidoreductase subunit 6 (subunit J)